MPTRPSPARQVLAHPGAFVWRTLKAFRANQGPLLAGAVAYYALLSIVPMLILTFLALARVVDPRDLMETLSLYLEWLVPGQSAALLHELELFLAHREVAGWVLLGTMLFFSSLAFSVLENALSIIFLHRVKTRRRSWWVSLLMPYGFILCLAAGLLVVTMTAGQLEAMAARTLTLGQHAWSLAQASSTLLYAMGVAGELLLITAIYMVMPVQRLRATHALLGAVVATALWELSRHLLVWYFATLSQIGQVYGSLTTAIAVLLTLELAGLLLLLGAQLIAEFERLSTADTPSPAPLDLRPRAAQGPPPAPAVTADPGCSARPRN